MAHLCIKYRLNPDGTVPDFLCLHPEGVGGVYGVPSAGTTNHDDTVFVGLSEHGFESDTRFEVVPSQAALEAYLAAVGADWTVVDEPGGVSRPFDPAAVAASVWARLDALNAA